jgi:hypothetical protein
VAFNTANLNSLRGITSKEKVFLKGKEALSPLQLLWEKLTSVKSDSGKYV